MLRLCKCHHNCWNLPFSLRFHSRYTRIVQTSYSSSFTLPSLYLAVCLCAQIQTEFIYFLSNVDVWLLFAVDVFFLYLPRCVLDKYLRNRCEIPIKMFHYDIFANFRSGFYSLFGELFSPFIHAFSSRYFSRSHYLKSFSFFFLLNLCLSLFNTRW